MAEQTPPYNYSPITERPFDLPDGNRVAFWVIPNIEYYKLDVPYPTDTSDYVPNVQQFAWRDYGTRVGIWRMMDVLEEHDVRATVALNAEICDHAPQIIEAGVERAWEFMGHGITNSNRLAGLSPSRERAVIRETRDRIAEATGTTPRGWLGPGLAETFNTVEILAEEGFGYVGDWCNDDQPYPMTVGDPPLLAMPYSVEMNDIPMLLVKNYTGPDFEAAVKRQFDCLYAEGSAGGSARVMALAVHPYLTGQPYLVEHLSNAIEYVTGHDDVWICTGGEIAAHYREQYLDG